MQRKLNNMIVWEPLGRWPRLSRVLLKMMRWPLNSGLEMEVVADGSSEDNIRRCAHQKDHSRQNRLDPNLAAQLVLGKVTTVLPGPPSCRLILF
jgi:hypothetical protein